MKFVVVLLVVCSLSLAGCAAALTPGGQAVRLMKADPPANCQELGTVSGHGGFEASIEKAKNRMRNEAAEMGANYVRWEVVSSSNPGNVSVTGTAYKCP